MPRIAKILIAVVIAIPVLGIGAAYVAADLTQKRVAGNEASAIGALRAIVSAQATYAVTCGGYSPTLAGLASQGMLSPDLGTDPVERNGYVVAMRARDDGPLQHTTATSCEQTAAGYVVTAAPVEPGQTGVRYFKVDDTAEVTQATSAAFTDATVLR